MKTMLITLKSGEQLRIPCHHIDDDGWNLKLFTEDNELGSDEAKNGLWSAIRVNPKQLRRKGTCC